MLHQYHKEDFFMVNSNPRFAEAKNAAAEIATLTERVNHLLGDTSESVLILIPMNLATAGLLNYIEKLEAEAAEAQASEVAEAQASEVAEAQASEAAEAQTSEVTEVQASEAAEAQTPEPAKRKPAKRKPAKRKPAKRKPAKRKPTKS
jgi:spore cortex formation protein SpoVR/YcgB (stage V sporulation)